MVETKSERSKRYRLNAIAEGKCPSCYRPLKPRRKACAICLKKRRKIRRKRYDDRLANGLCPGCGGPRDTTNIQCSRCRQANNIAHAKIPTAKRNEYQYTYLRKNRRLGLCPTCGRAPEPGYIHCSTCLGRWGAYHSRMWLEHKVRAIRGGYYSMKKPKVLCPICQLHHLRCEYCGKYMHPEHGEHYCRWSCVCQNEALIAASF